MTYSTHTYFTALMPDSSAAVRLPPIAAAYFPMNGLALNDDQGRDQDQGDEERHRQAEEDVLAPEIVDPAWHGLRRATLDGGEAVRNDQQRDALEKVQGHEGGDHRRDAQLHDQSAVEHPQHDPQ